MSKRRQRNRALIDAALRSDVVELRRLLAEGADVDARDPEHGETALMLARSEEATRLLVDAGADVNARDDTGRTPIRYGAYPLLVEAGADVNVQDNHGMTPLMWAVVAAGIDQVRQFVAWGADVNLSAEDGSTALDLSVRHGLLAISVYLRSVGAKLSLVEGCDA